MAKINPRRPTKSVPQLARDQRPDRRRRRGKSALEAASTVATANANTADGSSGPPHVLRRFLGNFRWQDVILEPYKISAHRGGEFCRASRQVLLGASGEPVDFNVRYFELQRGGFTSLERHRHCHFVIGVRGRGWACVGEQQYRIGPLDVLYIGPDEPHQLRAGRSPTFGFFCIVDGERDRPRPIDS